jgi:hypothetical protein
MDSLLNWIGIGSAALLAVAVAVAWLEHRARLAELRRELETAENSRFMLEEHIRDVDEQLLALNAALESQQKSTIRTHETSAPRSMSDAALQRIAARAAAEDAPEAPTSPPSGWVDTLPMVQTTELQPTFEPTRPVDLHPH